MKSRVALALLVALLCAGAVAGSFAVAYATDVGRQADARIFDRLGRGNDTTLRRLGHHFGGHNVDMIASGGVVAIVVLLALLSLLGRARVGGLLTVLLIGGAFITTELLKRELAERGRELAPFRLPRDSFPSGHATLAMATVLALVMAVPARRRLAATICGALLATVLGLLVVVGGLHPPSDVVGGFLVATGWAALLTPVVRRARASPDATERRGLLGGVGAGVLVLAGLAFTALVSFYVEDIFGIHRALLFLVSGLAMVSIVIVVSIGNLADLAERRR